MNTREKDTEALFQQVWQGSRESRTRCLWMIASQHPTEAQELRRLFAHEVALEALRHIDKDTKPSDVIRSFCEDDDKLTTSAYAQFCTLLSNTLQGPLTIQSLPAAVRDDPEIGRLCQYLGIDLNADSQGLDKPSPGRVVGNKSQYKLVRVLGEGGQGMVWYAEALTQVQHSPSIVAVKFPLNELGGRPNYTNFEEECIRLEQVRDRAIVKHIEHGDDQRLGPYLVMEYVEGQSLDKFATLQAAKISDVIRIGHELARGINVLHRAGVLHRDISPKNVIVYRTSDGFSPKLIDFGLARNFASQRTITQLAAGSLGFVAPEVIQHSSYSIQSDVFSLGATLRHAMSKVEHRDKATNYWDKLKFLADIVETSTDANPHFRMDSAEKLADQLGSWLRLCTPSSGRRSEPLDRYWRSRPSPLRAVGVCMFLVVLLNALLWYLFRSVKDSQSVSLLDARVRAGWLDQRRVLNSRSWTDATEDESELLEELNYDLREFGPFSTGDADSKRLLGAELALCTGQFQQAKALLLETLSSVEAKAPRSALHSHTLLMLGEANRHEGEFDAAEQYLLQAIAISSNLSGSNATVHLGRSLCVCAELKLSTGRYTEAVALANEALNTGIHCDVGTTALRIKSDALYYLNHASADAVREEALKAALDCNFDAQYLRFRRLQVAVNDNRSTLTLQQLLEESESLVSGYLRTHGEKRYETASARMVRSRLLLSASRLAEAANVAEQATTCAANSVPYSRSVHLDALSNHVDLLWRQAERFQAQGMQEEAQGVWERSASVADSALSLLNTEARVDALRLMWYRTAGIARYRCKHFQIAESQFKAALAVLCPQMHADARGCSADREEQCYIRNWLARSIVDQDSARLSDAMAVIEPIIEAVAERVDSPQEKAMIETYIMLVTKAGRSTEASYWQHRLGK